jgi:hypothetical protein
MADTTTGAQDELRGRVRDRYAAAATTVMSGEGDASCCAAGTCGGHEAGSCCGPTVLEVDDTFGGSRYTAGDRDSLPIAAVAASLGAATRSRSPSCARASESSILVPAVESMSCCRPGELDARDSCTGST